MKINRYAVNWRWFHRLVSGWLLLSYLPTASAQRPPLTISADSLTRPIQAIMHQANTPGLQVLLFTKDSLLYKFNGGVSNLKTKAPVTDQSLFRLGSISKCFVAIAALMLQEKNQLSLSDELKKAAPDIRFTNPWEATHPVRIVHLLEHTTGFDDLSLKDFAVNDSLITLQQGLDRTASTRQARWPPGPFMAYCNPGPTVVARLIEQKTGQDYESFVQQAILRPLGMKTATFRRNGAALTQLVTNYIGDEHPQAKAYEHYLDRSSGSLNAPALELMAFVQMLMNRGQYPQGQLVQPVSIDQMETPTSSLAARAGLKEGYGLCSYTTAYKGYIFHGHDGTTTGGLAHFLYNTELNLGLIVLVNSGGTGYGRINHTVLETVMKQVQPKSVPSYKLDKQPREALLGYYRNSHLRFSFTGWLQWLTGIAQVIEEDGHLWLKSIPSGNAVPLQAVSTSEFVQRSPSGYSTSWALVADDQGQPVLTNNDTRTMTKTTGVGAWLPLVVSNLALLITAMVGLLGVWWLVQYGWWQRQGKQLSVMSVRMPLWGYAICLLLALGTYFSAISADPFLLGVVGLASVTIFLASLLTAIFAGWACINLVRYQHQVPGRMDRVFLWIATSSALLLVGYMAVWGLIGIRLWA